MRFNVYTIGHSNHTAEALLGLLHRHAIQLIVDVRSYPRSQYSPQFDRLNLVRTLTQSGIEYAFLGAELGARSDLPSPYVDGKVSYEKVRQTVAFECGIKRVETMAGNIRLALMCAEKDPLDCHRTILIGRHLEQRGTEVQHILSDGQLETHREAITRLMSIQHIRHEEYHLFRTDNDLLEDSYRMQETKIAYVRKHETDSPAA